MVSAMFLKDGTTLRSSAIRELRFENHADTPERAEAPSRSLELHVTNPRRKVAAVADVQLKGDYGGDNKTLRSTWSVGHPFHPEGGKCPHDGKYLAPYVRSPEQASMLAHVTAHVP